MNAVLSIQDAYDQDQGIFSVLEKRRAVSSDSAEAGELSQGDLLRNQRFRDRSPKGTATQLIKQQPQNGRYIPFCGRYVLL